MFYDVFEKLCAQKGVNPGRAADEMGISRATVTNWKKNGYSPPCAAILAISFFYCSL